MEKNYASTLKIKCFYLFSHWKQGEAWNAQFTVVTWITVQPYLPETLRVAFLNLRKNTLAKRIWEMRLLPGPIHTKQVYIISVLSYYQWKQAPTGFKVIKFLNYSQVFLNSDPLATYLNSASGCYSCVSVIGCCHSARFAYQAKEVE